MNEIYFPEPYASLPLGEWKTPAEAKVTSMDAVIVPGESTGMTNGNSIRPVLGTNEITACTAVILYDRANKVAAVKHCNTWDTEKVASLIKLFPGNARLEAHVVGGYFIQGSSSEALVKNNTRIICEELDCNDTQIITKTFAVFPKKRPSDIAIDARTGTIIRGSEIYPAMAAPFERKHPSLLKDWPTAENLKKTRHSGDSAKNQLPNWQTASDINAFRKGVGQRRENEKRPQLAFDGTQPEFQRSGSLRLAKRP